MCLKWDTVRAVTGRFLGWIILGLGIIFLGGVVYRNYWLPVPNSIIFFHWFSDEPKFLDSGFVFSYFRINIPISYGPEKVKKLFLASNRIPVLIGDVKKKESSSVNWERPGILINDGIPEQRVTSTHWRVLRASQEDRGLDVYVKSLRLAVIPEIYRDLSQFFTIQRGQRIKFAINARVPRGQRERHAGAIFTDGEPVLLFHQVSLAFDGSESVPSQKSSNPGERSQNPIWYVCRGVQIAPLIRLALCVLCIFGGADSQLSRPRHSAVSTIGRNCLRFWLAVALGSDSLGSGHLPLLPHTRQ